MIKQTVNNKSNIPIAIDLQDYMFTSTNIDRYTKHMIQISDSIVLRPKSSLKHIEKIVNKTQIDEPKLLEEKFKNKCEVKRKKETMYRPKQKDSLF